MPAHGINQQTFYRWKAKYGGLEVGDAQKLKALEDENRRLERLVAGLALDNAALKDVLSKTGEARGPALGSPLPRRAAVNERASCLRGLAQVCRATVRNVSHRREDDDVKQRLRELAALRKGFGYRWVPTLLKREGRLVNHKRMHRLYREEGLSLRRRKRKRLTSEGCGPGEGASVPNQVWEP